MDVCVRKTKYRIEEVNDVPDVDEPNKIARMRNNPQIQTKKQNKNNGNSTMFFMGKNFQFEQRQTEFTN